MANTTAPNCDALVAFSGAVAVDINVNLSVSSYWAGCFYALPTKRYKLVLRALVGKGFQMSLSIQNVELKSIVMKRAKISSAMPLLRSGLRC